MRNKIKAVPMLDFTDYTDTDYTYYFFADYRCRYRLLINIYYAQRIKVLNKSCHGDNDDSIQIFKTAGK